MMIGYNITQPNDALQKITLQQLIQLISHPPNEILDKITILRNLKITDLNAYKHQKKLLPYFTTSIFHPPYRKSENFAATYYCIFDIDNLSSIQKTPDEIKEQISKLECTRLAFTSPGMDGVKLLIELHTPCKEPSQFKSFYSAFIRYLISNFSHLSAVIDRKTNDITRATFLSYDPHLFHNPSSVKINIQQIIDAYSDTPPISISDNTNSNETSSTSDASIASNNPSNNPDEETLQKIKNILGSKTLSKTNPKNVIPSQKVNDTIPLLKEKLLQENIKIIHTTPINYGQQITFQFENLVAQLNIFYGKKGFSIVPVPKRNTNTRLALHLQELLSIIIDEIEKQNNTLILPQQQKHIS